VIATWKTSATQGRAENIANRLKWKLKLSVHDFVNYVVVCGDYIGAAAGEGGRAQSVLWRQVKTSR
jgi:hypothetical protein